MTAAIAPLRGRPSSAFLTDLREQLLDTEEEIAALRDEALVLCAHALPEARRVRLVFANLGPDFHIAELLATNLVGRLEGYERRFAPQPDAPVAGEMAITA